MFKSLKGSFVCCFKIKKTKFVKNQRLINNFAAEKCQFIFDEIKSNK